MKFTDRARRTARSTFGFDLADSSEDWPSSPNRHLEARFGFARATVVLSVFLLTGPGGNHFGTTVPNPLVAVYSLYAAALIFVSVTGQRKPHPSFYVGVHVTDIFWSCAFAGLLHSSGPLWLLFLFPLMTAVCRWGASATLATTLTMVAGLQSLINMGLIGSTTPDDPSMFQMSASIILLGAAFALIGQAHGLASKNSLQADAHILPSGSPSQIIQSVMEKAFATFRPKYIQLLVDEAAGRTFIWHAERRDDSKLAVHSEEFDPASADRYLQLMPDSDWFLSRGGTQESLIVITPEGNLRRKDKIPPTFSGYFNMYANVVSASVRMDSEWDGRIIICDPAVHESPRKSLEILRKFCREVAPTVHTAQLCLRACRTTAAEECARLARELHDGIIQSLLGVELRLERLRLKAAAVGEKQTEISELQTILRNEAVGLRQLVTDSRRRALSPERLLEYVSDLLERFQRDSGFVTHFFADLNHQPMPPRVCHEIVRITEEAIINAKKHSMGSTLTLRIGCAADNWLLVIIDDGVGFDFRGTWSLEKLKFSGLGPRVIRERVQSLGGGLLIESTSAGARIEISIPMNMNSRCELFAERPGMQLQA